MLFSSRFSLLAFFLGVSALSYRSKDRPLQPHTATIRLAVNYCVVCLSIAESLVLAAKLFRASGVFRHHLLRPPRPFSAKPSHGAKRPCPAAAMRRRTLVPIACLYLDAGPFSRSCRGPSRPFGLARIHPRLQTTLRLCVSQISPPPSLGNELLRPYSPALGPGRGCGLLHLVESGPQEALRTSARISFLR